MSYQTESPSDPELDFLARSHRAIERARRDGSGISPEELMRRLDARLDAACDLLRRRGSSSAGDQAGGDPAMAGDGAI